MKDKLINLRKRLNLTQSEFGLIVGCTRQHINNMEKGRATVTVETLIKYAESFKLHVPVDFIKEDVNFDSVFSKILSFFDQCQNTNDLKVKIEQYRDELLTI